MVFFFSFILAPDSVLYSCLRLSPRGNLETPSPPPSGVLNFAFLLFVKCTLNPLHYGPIRIVFSVYVYVCTFPQSFVNLEY